MRPVLGGVAVVLLVLGGATPARAEPEGRCIELHCYCDGPNQQDTVASCDTTCEAVCGRSGGAGASAARATRLAKWAFTVILGPSYTSNDARGGTSVPEGQSLGVQLDGHFGRPSIGIFVRFALTSTAIAAPDVELAREQVLVFDWFGVGLEVSPRVAGGRRWELRPAAAVWIGSTAMFSCDGCAASVRTGDFADEYGSWGWGARAGFDLYLGVKRRRGLSVAIVYSQSQVGDLDAYELLPNSPSEHVAPTFMLQVGMTSLPGGR